MRIDDLDRERCSIEAEEAQIAALAWLGLDFDGPPKRQTADMGLYREALEQLAAKDLVFVCDRSRRDLRAAAEALGAPHESGSTIISTPSMRPEAPEAWSLGSGEVNHRLALPPGEESVLDEFMGPSTFDPVQAFGDPILWTRKDAPAYQLATVVDDMVDGITDVVRGEDLLPSAALQQRIGALLGAPNPRWWHLPLIHDADGRRLAKRDDDQTLESLRLRGIAPERVVGLLARTCEVQSTLAPMSADDFLTALDPASLQKWAQRESATGGYRLRPEELNWLQE